MVKTAALRVEPVPAGLFAEYGAPEADVRLPGALQRLQEKTGFSPRSMSVDQVWRGLRQSGLLVSVCRRAVFC
jgi:hypothetical protein